MNVNNQIETTNTSIPTGWQEVKLGDVVEINTETVKTTNKNLRIKYIDIASVESGKINQIQELVIKDAPSRARRVVKNNSILISTVRPNLRHYCFVKNSQENLIASTGFAVIETKKAEPKFIYYFLTTDDYTDHLTKIADGHAATYPSFNPDVFQKSKIHLPPLPEQQAIAAILSSLDDKIELLRDQNKTLEELGQKLFQKELIENGDGWRVGKITEIIKREPVKYKCNKDDLDTKGQTPIIDQGTNGLYGYTNRNADFIASPDSPVILFTNHTCNYWFVDYPFCAIQNVLPFRGKDGYDEYFLYFMTKGSVTFIEYKGHWPDFEIKDFLIPTVEKAQEFSKLSKPILQKMSANTQQIQILSKTRDTLLPQLMSGAVRVRVN